MFSPYWSWGQARVKSMPRALLPLASCEEAARQKASTKAFPLIPFQASVPELRR